MEVGSCFVYEVVRNSIDVRRRPSTADSDRTGVTFQPEELVSIDKVFVTGENCSFLRLSDGSGWLFGTKNGLECMRRLDVDTGLWAFYVDNYPHGQALRSHPTDRKDLRIVAPTNSMSVEVLFPPLQKIFCDKKVTHPKTGVCSYRVQGTSGWVFDRRPETNSDDQIMLINEDKLKTGLFAYSALCCVDIRNQTDVGDSSRTIRSVEKGDIVAVNAVRQSPFGNYNGPFLRLTDGSGWLFERKYGERMMQEIPVEFGKWTLKVLNSVGIALRRHPIDAFARARKKTADDFKNPNVLLELNETVECDCKISSPTGVNFYRVKNMDGWIFDTRDGARMLQLQEGGSRETVMWSPDFVRGLAFSVEGLEETYRDGQLISFRSGSTIKINVLLAKKSVEIMTTTGSHLRMVRSTSDLLKIFKNPIEHTKKSGTNVRAFDALHDVRPDSARSFSPPENAVDEKDEEEKARRKLLRIDAELDKLDKDRLALLDSIRRYDKKRGRSAAENAERAEKRKREVETFGCKSAL